MRVAIWGNSLAVGLHRSVVEALELEGGRRFLLFSRPQRRDNNWLTSHQYEEWGLRLENSLWT